MADNLSSLQRRVITNEATDRVYDRLLAIFDDLGIRATFAFVGLHTMSRDEVGGIRSDLSDIVMPNGRAWLQEFWRDFEAGRVDGWLNPRLRNKVRAYGVHEIGSHGFTHTPLSVETVDFDNFRREILLATREATKRGDRITTLVYPRNHVGYTPLLPGMKILGYRAPLAVGIEDLGRRFWNIASEFNIWTQSHPHSNNNLVAIAIPPGYILNARNSLPRRTVPGIVTIQRWRRIIRHAITYNGVVHLWSHPHNFITDPDLHLTLRGILELVQEAMKEGKLVNLTQHEYCEQILAQPPSVL